MPKQRSSQPRSSKQKPKKRTRSVKRRSKRKKRRSKQKVKVVKKIVRAPQRLPKIKLRQVIELPRSKKPKKVPIIPPPPPPGPRRPPRAVSIVPIEREVRELAPPVVIRRQQRTPPQQIIIHGGRGDDDFGPPPQVIERIGGVELAPRAAAARAKPREPELLPGLFVPDPIFTRPIILPRAVSDIAIQTGEGVTTGRIGTIAAALPKPATPPKPVDTQRITKLIRSLEKEIQKGRLLVPGEVTGNTDLSNLVNRLNTALKTAENALQESGDQGSVNIETLSNTVSGTRSTVSQLTKQLDSIKRKIRERNPLLMTDNQLINTISELQTNPDILQHQTQTIGQFDTFDENIVNSINESGILSIVNSPTKIKSRIGNKEEIIKNIQRSKARTFAKALRTPLPPETPPSTPPGDTLPPGPILFSPRTTAGRATARRLGLQLPTGTTPGRKVRGTKRRRGDEPHAKRARRTGGPVTLRDLPVSPQPPQPQFVFAGRRPSIPFKFESPLGQ